MTSRTLGIIHTLWDELSAFPASRQEDAMDHLMAWLRDHLDADDVVWLGGVLLQDGEIAANDPLKGWRLRAKRYLIPRTEAYIKLVASYLANEHYGKLTPSLYKGGNSPAADVHVGETSRKIVAGAGKFRAYRMRDGWIDYEKFRRTEHYRLYYTNLDITDRIWVVVPIDDRTESMFLIDRHRAAKGRRKNFTDEDTYLAATALRGSRELHRRALLYHGILRSNKALSPLKLRIVQGLLTDAPEKEIADAIGQRPLTLRKYISEIYAEFGVKSRAAFMALWLGG